MAEFFEVAETTLANWKGRYPEFRQAIARGKLLADAEIAECLYRMAVGYSVPVESVVQREDGEQEIITLFKQIRANAAAAKTWLQFRQPGKWRSQL